MRIKTIAAAFVAIAAAVTVAVTPVAASAVPPPTTSPALAAPNHVFTTATYNLAACPTGYECNVVADQSNPGYLKVFEITTCSWYGISYFYNNGYIANHQTGGAATKTTGSGGATLTTYPAGGNYSVNWNPVYGIRSC